MGRQMFGVTRPAGARFMEWLKKEPHVTLNKAAGKTQPGNVAAGKRATEIPTLKDNFHAGTCGVGNAEMQDKPP